MRIAWRERRKGFLYGQDPRRESKRQLEFG